MTGKKVREVSNLSGNEVMFDRDGLSNGLFYFRLTDKEANIVGSGKVVIL
jgi:hypothetical protein